MGQKILKSVSPGDLFLKVVYEKMTYLFLENDSQKHVSVSGAAKGNILLVGVQGNGKTTTCAKLGKYYSVLGKKCC